MEEKYSIQCSGEVGREKEAREGKQVDHDHCTESTVVPVEGVIASPGSLKGFGS